MTALKAGQRVQVLVGPWKGQRGTIEAKGFLTDVWHVVLDVEEGAKGFFTRELEAVR
jgi:hypothetical protein